MKLDKLIKKTQKATDKVLKTREAYNKAISNKRHLIKELRELYYEEGKTRVYALAILEENGAAEYEVDEDEHDTKTS